MKQQKFVIHQQHSIPIPQELLLLTWINCNAHMDNISKHMPYKDGLKLLIYSKTSVVVPFNFEYE